MLSWVLPLGMDLPAPIFWGLTAVVAVAIAVTVVAWWLFSLIDRNEAHLDRWLWVAVVIGVISGVGVLRYLISRQTCWWWC